MRNKKSVITSFVFFTLFLLLLMSLPRPFTEKIRGFALAITAPSFHAMQKIKGFFKKSSVSFGSHDPGSVKLKEENLRLQSENTILTSLLQQTRELLENEIELKYYIEMLKKSGDEALNWLEDQAQQRHSKLKSFIETKVQAVPANIIFRSPGAWSSSLWVDVGDIHNTAYGQEIIKKNSPVLSGDSIVGVIDYVGKRQSRVKLITDSGLSPSVRAVRKSEGKVLLLAKGELYGNSEPVWRGKKCVLSGIGFNYDFADEEGPARDLRSGQPLERGQEFSTTPIIAINDLLITTGMDGVFPPGLSVATVTQIEMLREGDYYYTIKAVPTAENLDDLSLVFIAPPYGYDHEDQVPL